MSAPQGPGYNLFRVRKTVQKMLRKRGYIVDDNDLSMDYDTFKTKYGDTRERNTILVTRLDDDNDKLMVFFPNEPKVGVGPIRKMIDQMSEYSCRKGVMVVLEDVTPFARQTLQQSGAKLQLEYFKDSELLVDITEHQLVPEHQVLTAEEKRALLARYKLRDNQLPRMQLGDPVSRYFGLVKGQVVKITRPSETAGRYVTYRLVV